MYNIFKNAINSVRDAIIRLLKAKIQFKLIGFSLLSISVYIIINIPTISPTTDPNVTDPMLVVSPASEPDNGGSPVFVFPPLVTSPGEMDTLTLVIHTEADSLRTPPIAQSSEDRAPRETPDAQVRPTHMESVSEANQRYLRWINENQ